jgi:hypothetical protein
MAESALKGQGTCPDGKNIGAKAGPRLDPPSH